MLGIPLRLSLYVMYEALSLSLSFSLYIYRVFYPNRKGRKRRSVSKYVLLKKSVANLELERVRVGRKYL
jgi:hypothetical protein